MLSSIFFIIDRKTLERVLNRDPNTVDEDQNFVNGNEMRLRLLNTKEHSAASGAWLEDAVNFCIYRARVNVVEELRQIIKRGLDRF